MKLSLIESTAFSCVVYSPACRQHPQRHNPTWMTIQHTRQRTLVTHVNLAQIILHVFYILTYTVTYILKT